MTGVAAAQFPLLNFAFGKMGGDLPQINLLLVVSVVACFLYLPMLCRKPVEGTDGEEVLPCTGTWCLHKWCYPP